MIKTSTANSLDVARDVKAALPSIQESLPEGTRIFVAFDSTRITSYNVCYTKLLRYLSRQ